MPTLATLTAPLRHLRGVEGASVTSEFMATTRFRFSPESLAALGINATMPPEELTARLNLGVGVKVTSAKADGSSAVLNISGATLADGTEPSGGEVTGSFNVSTQGRITFDGFRYVDGTADEPTAAAVDLSKEG